MAVQEPHISIVLYLKGPVTPRGDRQRGGGTYAPHLPDAYSHIPYRYDEGTSDCNFRRLNDSIYGLLKRPSIYW